MHETEAGTVGESEPRSTEGADETPGEARRADSPARGVAEVPDDRGRPGERESSQPTPVPSSRRLGLATLGVLAVALAALVPTVGDLGLTWDEPAYRYSQVMSAQWWEQLGQRPVLGSTSGRCSTR